MDPLRTMRDVQPLGRSLSCHLPRYTLHVTRYTLHFWMAILRFRHKGLGRFFSAGSAAGIQSKHATRLRLILGRLSVAVEPRDMGLPGLALHPLKGTRKGTWAVSVRGNWRVTFRLEGPDATDVDYEDYHLPRHDADHRASRLGHSVRCC